MISLICKFWAPFDMRPMHFALPSVRHCPRNKYNKFEQPILTQLRLPPWFFANVIKHELWNFKLIANQHKQILIERRNFNNIIFCNNWKMIVHRLK